MNFCDLSNFLLIFMPREILTEMNLMRSLFLSAVMLLTAFAAQAQQSYGIAYQAVARDADGDALENATLDVRFTLTDAADAAVWTETHNGIMTDAFGLINLTIGSVEGAEGLAAVDWSAGGFAFQVEVNSGDGFELFGSMTVTSAPVALFAASAPEPKADSLAVVTAQEAADRASADSGLQGQIDGNDADIATNAGAISTNATAISDETSARTTADSGLQGQIDGNDADIATNAGAISTNATAISDETSARTTADSGLQGQIDGNDADIATNAGAISTNATAISDEATARAAADGTLQDNLDAEAAARFNNDSFLSGMISANGVADAAVEARVTALENQSSTAALDAVDSLDTAHSAEILANTTALSTESAARIAADAGLQGQVDGNDTDIAANAGAISTNATAISGNASAIVSNTINIATNSTNISNNYGAMSSNATAIADEATARAAADADLQTQIDNLPNSVPSIGAVVEDLLDGTQEGAGLNADGSYVQSGSANYISAATSLANADDLLDAAIKAVQDDVDGNEADTDAAILALQQDVDANELASDNAEGALQTELDGTQTGAGLGTDGAYAANGAANYTSAATSLMNADNLLDAQAKANADEIIATDYFDQTDVTLHAGAGETWTGIETANGSFTTGVSTGTMTASGNATVGGTLGVTGATALDGTLGVDGSVRVGTNGAIKMSIDASTGTATLAGDIVALTGGIASGSLTITGSSTLQNVSTSSMSVSGLITVPTPSLGSAAANKSYVDGAISTAVSAASSEAWSYKGSADCSFVNGYLVLDESDLAGAAETITVFGADLDAASTFALANEGNSLSLTPTVADGNSLSFDLTHAQAAALSSCTGDLYLHFNLIIDGKNSGLTLFIRVQA